MTPGSRSSRLPSRCRSAARHSLRLVTGVPNLREAITLGTAAALFASVAIAPSHRARRRAPEPASGRDIPWPRAGVPGRAFRSAVRSDRLGAVDTELGVLDRIHARQRRAPSDALLRLLRARPGQHHRRRLRGQPADAFPLLRGADARDVPAGHPPWRRGSKTRRPYLSWVAPSDLDRVAVPGRRRDLGSSRERSTSGRAGSSPDKVSDVGATVLLALFMFGIGKAALMPFHRWLPAAMVAPTPVSALLHAVAVVKAGVFAVVKIIVYTFGVDAGRRELRLAALRRRLHHHRRLDRRAPRGQPEAPARVLHGEPALLRRPGRGAPDAPLGGRSGTAHCRTCVRQDHLVLRRGRHLHRGPQDRSEPARRHRPPHALDLGRVRHRVAVHDRPAADGGHGEQVVHGDRRVSSAAVVRACRHRGEHAARTQATSCRSCTARSCANHRMESQPTARRPGPWWSRSWRPRR